MEIKYFQKGFNYSQDGPGNRLVIHLQGCNLHCPWCSNPEGMDFNGGILTDTDNLFKEILSCKRLFFDGGGVTFTGGECTMQKQALLSLLKKCKENQIHTAIETNSTCPFDNELFSFVDLIICDFKHHNEQILKETVGNVFEYKKNIMNYVSSKKQVLIRTVLIKGFNSSKNDAEEFAKFFSSLQTQNVSFEFLPYHEYGKNKWTKLNKEYVMKDAFIDDETLIDFENTFKKYNLKVIRS